MTSVVKRLLSLAMALCLLAGTASLTIFASDVSECCADAMSFSEVIGEGVQQEVYVAENVPAPAPVAVARMSVERPTMMCEEPESSEVVGEGVQQEVQVWVSTTAPVAVDCAVMMCEENAISGFIGDGVQKEVCSDEYIPVPDVGISVAVESYVPDCDAASPFALDEPAVCEPIALDIPAPPVNSQ